MSIKMKQFWLKEWTRKSCKRVKRSIMLGWVGLGWAKHVYLFKIFLLS